LAVLSTACLAEPTGPPLFELRRERFAFGLPAPLLDLLALLFGLLAVLLDLALEALREADFDFDFEGLLDFDLVCATGLSSLIEDLYPHLPSTQYPKLRRRT